MPVCYQVFNNSFLLNYLFVSLALFYFLPCLLLCILYLKIMLVIRNRRKEKLTELNHNNNNNHEAKISLTSTYSAFNPNKLSVTGADPTLNRKHSTISGTKRIQVPKINEKQIIILLIIMMLLVLICLLPIRVFTVWFALSTKEQRQRLGIINYSIILTFCRVLFYLNSVLNPIFYHFMSTKFQNAFKKFFNRQAKPRI